MAQRINTPTSTAYNFPVNLDGQSIYLRITWNTRTESWYVDIFDELREVIELEVRISARQPLVVFGIEDWPLEGNLFVAPTATETEVSQIGQALSRDNFGGQKNYQLFYVPRREYANFVGA